MRVNPAMFESCLCGDAMLWGESGYVCCLNPACVVTQCYGVNPAMFVV